MGHSCGWLLILWRFRHPVPALPGIYVWFKSLIARYVPGNVLMVMGRVMMIQPYGVPKRISLTSVAYEQALLAASATAAISLALPFWAELRDLSELIWLVLVVPPLAIASLHPAVLGRLGNYLLRKVGREQIEDFLPFRDIFMMFIYYSLFWVVAGLSLFAMLRTVTDVGLSDLPIILASTPLAWLVSVLFFIFPSGLGVREGVYVFTLGFAFKEGFPANYRDVSTAFALVLRFWQTLVEIGLLLVVMGVVKARHLRIRAAATPETLEGEGQS